MQWQTIMVIVIAMLLVLFPVFFIWYICGGGIYEAIKCRRRAKLLKKALPNLACSLDIDCPPGFVCLEGRCVPQKM